MKSRILLLSAIFLIVLKSYAQILPAQGARLHYNQIMFEYEKVSGAVMYVVQLAIDSEGESFEHCLIEQKDPATATMISGVAFGKKYKWRYTG